MAKEWAWSFSKLKNFETCPMRHNEIDLKKSVVEEIKPGSPLDFGNRAHKAIAAALEGKGTLPDDMAYQEWIDAIHKWPGELLIEQQYAITRDFKKTGWFSHNVWYRGIGDVVKIYGPVGLVIDWKTGRMPDEPISPQLFLMAQCLFSHYPQLKSVRSEFVWLQENESTPMTYDRMILADLWPEMLDRVAAMEKAHAEKHYPPKPSGLCKKYCPVTSCQYHGKGAY